MSVHHQANCSYLNSWYLAHILLSTKGLTFVYNVYVSNKNATICIL